MIWTPLLPALALTAYFVLGLGWFAVEVRRGHVPLDADVQRRSASPLLGRFLRRYLMWVLAPWERALVTLGVSPNAITGASLVTALGAAIALGAGRFALGGWLYFLTGILDILDGRVARAGGNVTTSGAYFDSVADRYAELCVFGGLAWFYRGSPVLIVVLLAAIGSMMVSYSRARAESLGVTATVGTMQRPERVFYLGLAMVLAPILENLVGHGALPAMPLLVAVLGWLALSTNVTAIVRIRHSLSALAEPPASSSVSSSERVGGVVVPLRKRAVSRRR